MSVASKTPTLDRRRRPAGLRNLSTGQLKELAADGGLRFRPMTLLHRLIEHDSRPSQHETAGLNAPQLVNAEQGALDRRDLRLKSTLASAS